MEVFINFCDDIRSLTYARTDTLESFMEKVGDLFGIQEGFLLFHGGDELPPEPSSVLTAHCMIDVEYTQTISGKSYINNSSIVNEAVHFSSSDDGRCYRTLINPGQKSIISEMTTLSLDLKTRTYKGLIQGSTSNEEVTFQINGKCTELISGDQVYSLCQPVSTIWGLTFVQVAMLGLASYHFKPEPYISYASAPRTWALESGKPLPRKKYFTDYSYDEETRTFVAVIDWSSDPFAGMKRWEYKMVFNETLMFIESGFCKTDEGHQDWLFGTDLCYLRKMS
eukprot:TRINITY_DN30463_c0_g1_i1.p1 TRINITY_DN30463_c0_g1~~TRINITY_DN30463_c0_g1_i1.p1  ORF type:complete len:281 (+),score=31.13 TRINITY_DN30463_c0_g1_i1:222-1064(+)